MANFYTDRYNRFLENVNLIYDYLSGNYMDRYVGKLLQCDSVDLTVGGVKLVEICQYRKLSDDQTTFDKIRDLLKNVLSMYHANDFAVAYFIVSSDNTMHLYFASEDDGIQGFDSVISTSIPESVYKVGFVSKEQLKKCSKYGGVITGSFNINKPVIDAVFDVMENKNCVVGLIAFPSAPESGQAYKNAFIELRGQANGFDSVEKTFGSGSRITIHDRFPQNEQLLDYINKQVERLEGNTRSLWKTAIWFGAELKTQALKLAGMISGTFSESGKSEIEKGRYFFTTSTPFLTGQLGISFCDFSKDISFLNPALKKGSLYSYMTTEELSSIFQLPMKDHVGLVVIDKNVSADTIFPFSLNTPKSAGKTIALGNESAKGREYFISVDDIQNHMLVTGASGSGKTNTIWVIVEALYGFKVPFCIIEPAKKEYWHLITGIKDLKIYSPDNDALPLRLNPLEPEEGIIISDHISNFMYALSGAVEMDEPTKESMAGLLRYTYGKFGWGENELAYRKNKDYPLISDVINNLNEYSDREIRSGTEVKMNLIGAVYRRLKEISTGVVGRVTGSRINVLTGEDLCAENVLVELDSISHEIKPFVTTLLLIKMNQYLRRRDSSKHLKNVVILEEAHNVLSEVSINRAETSKDISSKYFSGLLSEIRDYGTGIIIVDQGASQINANAVANTKIKIAHALNQEADAQAESFALNLNDFKMSYLTGFKTGEALVSVRGEENVCKVQVKRSGVSKKIINYACIHCKYARKCFIEDMKRGLGASYIRADLMLTKIFARRYDVAFVRKEANQFFDLIGLSEKYRTCAFGYLMAHSEIAYGERIKREIVFRYLCGEGEKNE